MPPTVLHRLVLPAGEDLRLSLRGPAERLDERSFRVPAGTTVTTAAWSGALPAAHWRRHTDVREVRLCADLAGPAEVRAVRDGAVVGDGLGTVPVGDRDDGGWLWAEVTAGGADVVVRDLRWEAGAVPPGTLTVSITTVDRQEAVLGVLAALASSSELLAVLDEVLVVDQGSRPLRAEPGLTAVEQALGGRLRVLEQDNLGGSGGAARGCLEALEAGRSRHVLLLDDDVALQPEAVLRALAFADRCRVPTLVGGGMLDLHRPTVLHTPGERVDPDRFLWETVPPGREDVDLATAELSDPSLDRRLDVSHNAWWMCLVPLDVLRRTGLPLPLFLKWDDVELGLRAGAAGSPTVTLPGVGVRHEPWTGKADTLDWQAWFHHRNRFVAGLLHSPRPRGGRLVPESLLVTLRHLAAMRTSVVALRLDAMEALLDGPGALHASLRTALPRARAVRRGHPDAEPLAAPLPEVVGPDRPAGRLVPTLLRSLVARPPRSPQAHLAPSEALWARLAGLDHALVTTADGRTCRYVRDRRATRRLLVRTLVLHARLAARWPALRTAFRATDLTGVEVWRATLAR